MLISVGKLYTAFKLAPDDLTDLRTLLPALPVIPINRLIIDPEGRAAHKNASQFELTDDLISRYADEYASKVYKLPRTRKRIVELALGHLLDMYWELEFEEGIRLELNELSASWRNEHFYGLLWPYIDGSLASLKKAIYSQLCGSYVFFSLVDLDEAVQLLYSNYYPLHREVKGLTRERYLEIVSQYFTPTESEVKLESTIEVKTEPDSEAPATPKGIKPSFMVRAIKDEAVRQGLDESYGITPRTLWNWRHKATTPPPGFSEEVMQSEEAALEFAKKYIEQKVSGGSSELAANAKKEIGYNPQLHGITIDNPEDALLVAESFKDLALSMDGGKEAEKKRKAKRKDLK